MLLVPLDVPGRDHETCRERRAARASHYPLDPVAPDPRPAAEAAALLAGGEEPLVIAGGGLHSARGYRGAGGLQELGLSGRHHRRGQGRAVETHPLSFGVVGYFMGRARAAELAPMVRQADVVPLVGNRTNQNGTDSWQLYPRDARYIQIDIDGTEVGRNYEALRLVGDARLGLRHWSRRWTAGPTAPRRPPGALSASATALPQVRRACG